MKLVMRGFSREDFKSPLDAIISTFCAQKKTKSSSRMAVLLTKRISVNIRKLACYNPTGLYCSMHYLKFIFLKKKKQKNTTFMSFAYVTISVTSESLERRLEYTVRICESKIPGIQNHLPIFLFLVQYFN